MKVRSKNVKIMAVASGKGGVGKTNLAANLAVALSDAGQRVLVFDADLGLANIDVLFGIAPRFNMRNVLDRSRTLDEILVSGPNGITIVPASSGVAELADLPQERSAPLFEALCGIASNYDTILIDTPAGIGSNALRFSLLADEILAVTTPEPTSITDTYALVKTIRRGNPHLAVQLVVNMAEDLGEAKRVAEAFSEITERFLGSPTACIGGLPTDASVPLAVRRQRPFVTSYPDCQASRMLRRLSRRLAAAPAASPSTLWPPSLSTNNRIAGWLDSWRKKEGTGS